MTKKEKEILANIRNKYTPILTFFNLWDQVVNNTTLSDQQKQDLFTMINKEQGLASENVKTISKLLKSLG